MRLTRKPMVFGLSALALVAIGLAAFFGLWAFNGSAGGVKDGVKYQGIISYEVRDAAGNLKESKVIHNAASTNMVTDIRAALSTVATTAAYDDIALCTTNVNVTPVEGFTPTACAALAVEITNPDLNNTVTNGGTTTKPNYKITGNFVATGTSLIREAQLVKSGVAATIPTTNIIGASQKVTIDLATGDTLDITWTVSVAGS